MARKRYAATITIRIEFDANSDEHAREIVMAHTDATPVPVRTGMLASKHWTLAQITTPAGTR